MNLENINYYNKEYNKKGYFVIKNVIKKNFIKKILNEIYQAKNVDKYKDSQGNLRRIERLYNKGKSLKSLNQKILGFLGEMVFMLILMEYSTLLIKIMRKKKVGMNTQTFLLMF